MSYKLFLFLVLLLFLGLWGYLRYEAAGDKNSNFNQTRRYSLGKSPTWRWVLGLHSVGDARSEYLTNGEPIIIEVLTAKGLEANEEGLRQFAREVERITGRKTTVVNVDLFEGGMVKDKDLPELVKSFRRHQQLSQPNIFVIYAGDFEGSQNGPGKAFNEYGLIVSDSALNDLTARYAGAMREYLPAVLMHQFGLQIGLRSSQDINCIMHEDVARPSRALLFSGRVMPDRYCDAEIETAKNIAAQSR